MPLLQNGDARVAAAGGWGTRKGVDMTEDTGQVYAISGTSGSAAEPQKPTGVSWEGSVG